LCVDVIKYKCMYDNSDFNSKNCNYTDNCWCEIDRVLPVEASMIQTRLFNAKQFIYDSVNSDIQTSDKHTEYRILVSV